MTCRRRLEPALRGVALLSNTSSSDFFPAHQNPGSGRSQRVCGVLGRGCGQRPQPHSWGLVQPPHWVDWAARHCREHARPRLGPLLPRVGSCSHQSHRAGMRELVMGEKSFRWPVPGHLVPACKFQAEASLVSLSLIPPTLPTAQTPCQEHSPPCPLLMAILQGSSLYGHFVHKKPKPHEN